MIGKIGLRRVSTFGEREPTIDVNATIDGAFDASDESPEETLGRIGREPDVGDIIWFNLTRGEAHARSLEGRTG